MLWIKALAAIAYVIWGMSLSVANIGDMITSSLDAPRVERMWRASARIHQEFWIVAPPGLLFDAVNTWRGDRPYMIVLNALTLFFWWQYRNWPDENRWKRRGRKLKDAIAVRAGRLVVVPNA